MKAPARVLLVSTLVSVFVVFIVLYRYDLLKGIGSGGESVSNKEAALIAVVPTTSGESASPEQLANGKKLYETMTCILCHGDTGASDSPTGKAMNATNLMIGQFKANKASLPAVQYIAKVIEEGVPGTGMASFKAQISNEKDRKDLAEYVHSLAGKK